jgi:uncharacterized protein (TIGR03067 family)
MKMPIFAALIAGLAICISSESLTRGDAAVDKHPAELDGAWIVQSIVRDPPEKRADEGKGLRCMVSGDKVVVKLPDAEKAAGGLIIKTDPDAKLKTIDLWPDESSFGKPIAETLAKEPPVLGIYKLEGDILTICWARQEDRERPREFASAAGSERSVIVLKRDR